MSGPSALDTWQVILFLSLLTQCLSAPAPAQRLTRRVADYERAAVGTLLYKMRPRGGWSVTLKKGRYGLIGSDLPPNNFLTQPQVRMMLVLLLVPLVLMLTFSSTTVRGGRRQQRSGGARAGGTAADGAAAERAGTEHSRTPRCV